jgi:hypothetical protein
LRMSFDCVNIQDLPRDLFLGILSFLDVGSLLHICSCSQDFHQLLILSELWERRFRSLWPGEDLSSQSPIQLRRIYKRELFRRPRIRFDGAYVSRCVYSRRIQEGASLTDSRTFLQIVYHRIIRFLPDNSAFMVISEKGGKGSARQVFDDLVQADKDSSLLEKYRRQIHRCQWRIRGEVDEGVMVTLTYFDGKLCWSADLLACSGTERRHGGSRLEWYEYRFWDPSEVVDYRRRELYRERETVAIRLRRAQIDTTDVDTLSDLLFQYERLGEALRAVRETHDDPVDSIPSPLLRQITLCQEHFPQAKFVHSSTVSHLF